MMPSKQARKQAGKQLRKQLFTELRPYRARLFLAGLTALLGSGLMLLMPELIKRLVDGLGQDDLALRLETTQWALLMLGGIVVAQAVFSYVENYFTQWVGERLTLDVRSRYFRHLLSQPLPFFQTNSPNELASRLSDDITAVRRVVTQHLIALVRSAVTVSVVLVLLVLLNPALTLIALAATVIIGAGGTFAFQSIRRLSVSLQDQHTRLIALANEALRNVPVIKSFVRESWIYDRYQQQSDEVLQTSLKRGHLQALIAPIANLIGFGTIGLVLWMAVRDVATGAMTSAELIAYLGYAFLMAGSFSTLTANLGAYNRESGTLQHVFNVLATEAAEAETTVPAQDPVDGTWELRGVEFAYSEDSRQILKGINLTIPAGSAVALVGPSGAGKSTLIQLLIRSFDPQRGFILLDGHDISERPAQWVREQVGVVFQEPYLFHTSIRENIRFGRPGASDAEVEAVAIAANVHTFCELLPDGIDTLAGEQGARLSRGQAQRIAIARMLLKDPRLVILDEATASLDSENEQDVQDALQQLMHGRTTLIISHRLTSLRGVDRVAVLYDGQIAEVGTPSELLQQGGLYARLYEMQIGRLALVD